MFIVKSQEKEIKPFVPDVSGTVEIKPSKVRVISTADQTSRKFAKARRESHLKDPLGETLQINAANRKQSGMVNVESLAQKPLPGNEDIKSQMNEFNRLQGPLDSEDYLN